jgi:hypothetical protein
MFQTKISSGSYKDKVKWKVFPRSMAKDWKFGSSGLINVAKILAQIRTIIIVLQILEIKGLIELKDDLKAQLEIITAL